MEKFYLLERAQLRRERKLMEVQLEGLGSLLLR